MASPDFEGRRNSVITQHCSGPLLWWVLTPEVSNNQISICSWKAASLAENKEATSQTYHSINFQPLHALVSPAIHAP